LDFEFFYNSLGGKVSEAWNVDDGHGHEGKHLIISKAIFLSEGFLVLEVSKGTEIVWGVRRDTGDNAGTLAHQNGHHRKSIDDIVLSVGGL
jgi:hypothetical protein